MQQPEIEVHETDEPAVKTIDRAVRLLWILAQGNSEGMPLSGISRLSGFGKGTTHRLLAALVAAPMLLANPPTASEEPLSMSLTATAGFTVTLSIRARVLEQ